MELMKQVKLCYALNGLSVMNTWFEKRDIYKYTWQHPSSKRWHYINYNYSNASDAKEILSRCFCDS